MNLITYFDRAGLARRIAAMLMMLASAGASPSTTSLPPGDGWYCASATSAHAFVASDSPSVNPSDFMAMFDAARFELSATSATLDVLADGLDVWNAEYLADLAAALDAFKPQSDAIATADIAGHANLFAQLATTLAAKRAELLERAPSAQTWLRLARAAGAEGSLVVPTRYVVKQPIKHIDLDIEALNASVWVDSNFA